MDSTSDTSRHGYITSNSYELLQNPGYLKQDSWLDFDSVLVLLTVSLYESLTVVDDTEIT